METISSSNMLGDYFIFQSEGANNLYNVSGDEHMARSIYLSKAANLIFPVIRVIMNYKKSTRLEGVSREAARIENSTANRYLPGGEKMRIDDLKERIETLRNLNKNIIDQLVVKGRILKNLSEKILTPLEDSNRRLKEISEEISLNTDIRRKLIGAINYFTRSSRYNQERSTGTEIEDLEIEAKSLKLSYLMLDKFIYNKNNELYSVIDKYTRYKLEDIPMIEKAKEEIEEVIKASPCGLGDGNSLAACFNHLIEGIKNNVEENLRENMSSVEDDEERRERKLRNRIKEKIIEDRKSEETLNKAIRDIEKKTRINIQVNRSGISLDASAISR